MQKIKVHINYHVMYAKASMVGGWLFVVYSMDNSKNAVFVKELYVRAVVEQKKTSSRQDLPQYWLIHAMNHYR